MDDISIKAYFGESPFLSDVSMTELTGFSGPRITTDNCRDFKANITVSMVTNELPIGPYVFLVYEDRETGWKLEARDLNVLKSERFDFDFCFNFDCTVMNLTHYGYREDYDAEAVG